MANEIYIVRYTNAPQAYDYGYVIVDHDCVGSTMKGEEVRRVLIPERFVEYQTGRYRSGMYPVWKSIEEVKEAGYFFN